MIRSFFHKSRRWTCVLLTVMTVCLFAACGETACDPLGYQVYPIEAAAELTVRGQPYSVLLRITSPSDASVSFADPPELSGFSLTVSPDGAFLSVGDAVIPLPDGTVLSALPALFSLAPDALTVSCETDEDGEPVTVLSAPLPGGSVQVRQRAAGAFPFCMDAVWNGISLTVRFPDGSL